MASKDFTAGYQAKGLDGRLSFAVEKFAVVEFNMNLTQESAINNLLVKDSSGNNVLTPELMQNSKLKMAPTNVYNASNLSDYFMLPAVCSSETYTITRETTSIDDAVLYQIKVTEYDTQEEAQAVVDEYIRLMTMPTYTVSGNISSEIDLTGGIVTLVNIAEESKNVKSEPITKNEDGTYHYIVNDVLGNETTYKISVEATNVIEGKYNIDTAKLAEQSITVGTVNIDNVDFGIEYKEIPENIWDFSNIAEWTACSYSTKSESFIYKGLSVVLDNATVLFATNIEKNAIQIKKATIKIPVSGSGKVICTFFANVKTSTTLGNVLGDGKTKTITATYENAEDIVLCIKDESYLQKIEVIPDTTDTLVTQLGASVRQETAAWGNGIRFGGQLDLTKVDIESCESGTLIGLVDIVGEGNEIILDSVGTTCIKVVRTTFIKEADEKLEYVAALIKIPESELDTKIIARPYVIVDGITYYGKQIITTYNEVMVKINAQ